MAASWKETTTYRQIHGVAHRARQFVRNRGIPTSRSDVELLRMKNVHAGRKAVIIGMGPSLRVEDLERLGNCVTFGVNKIFLAYDRTDWRPDYYLVCDQLVARQNVEAIRTAEGVRLLDEQCRHLLEPIDDVTWFRTGSPTFSHNPVGRLGGGRNILFPALQLALWMGVREAYLIGVDFSFDVPDGRTPDQDVGEAIVGEGRQNHFDPRYRKPGELWTTPSLDEMRDAFAAAGQAFEAAGGKLLNASRATKLDVLDRVDFEETFPLP